MDTVEITLLDYKVRFRKLSWREEFALPPGSGGLQIMAAAMVDVSGLPVATVADARRILDAVPPTILRRVWILYKAGIPAPLFFHTVNLYTAPDVRAFHRKIEEEDGERDRTADAAVAQVRSRFGARAVAEQDAIGQQILANAKKDSGARALVPATEQEL
jgi:hypothetical protein